MNVPHNTVAFVASVSGAGKTTLMEAVIKRLKAKDLRVGAVKHSNHAARVDRPGSDSWRFGEAGSEVTVLAALGTLTVMRKRRGDELVEVLLEASRDTDIVLVEGFREMNLPKIEVFRSGVSSFLYCRQKDFKDPDLVAVASDIPLDLDVPILDLNDPDSVCDFIMERFIKTSKGKSRD